VGIPWQDHFGLARQHAHDLCSGDWITFLDSDDELIGGGALRALVNQPGSPNAAYMLRYWLDVGPDGKPGTEFWRERMVRKDAYHWQGRVHEVLVPTVAAPYERSGCAHVIHHGSGDPIAKLQRNIRLLEMAAQDDPSDARTLFYLGRDLVASGERGRGKDALERYLLLSGWPDEAYIARQLIGDCLRVARDYCAAYRSDLQLLDIKPLWPQGYFALAQDCYYMQRWPESVHFCTIGQSLPIPDTNLFVDKAYIYSGWMIFEAVALYNAGQPEDALAITVEALKLRPDDPHHLFNYNFFKAKGHGYTDPLSPARKGG
jgi:glycosyltransferase involved in cell wall biosynthesis